MIRQLAEDEEYKQINPRNPNDDSDWSSPFSIEDLEDF